MSTDQLTRVYTIERLDTTNLTDVEKLYTAVYGRILQPGFFLKKYDTAFTGVNNIGYIAYNNDRIPIGYYGVIPCFIKIKGELILSAQSADTMTHPQHRFKGLFAELAILTFQLCRDNGIHLLFGFPNQNSLHGFINKLGWQTTETMDVFVINLLFPWQKLINRLSFTRGLYKSYLQKRLKAYVIPQNGFENPVFDEGFGGVYRDKNYLEYKTYNNSYTIKIGQAIIWIKISNVLLIGDMLVDPQDFNTTIDQLKILANKLGLKQIHFHTSTDTTLQELFTKRFIAMPSFPVIFKELSGDYLPLNDLKFTSADIDTF